MIERALGYDMDDNFEGIRWLLERVHAFEMYDPDRRPATHRNIWAGSYDVWSCEQDRIDAQEIPKARMKYIEDNGFIESKTIQRGKYDEVVWSLTERGRDFLKKEARSSNG